MRFRDWSLRWKILTMLVIASALPLAALAGIAFQRSRDQIRDSSVRLLQARAEAVVQAVDDFNTGLLRAVQRLSSLPETRAFAGAPNDRRVATIQEVLDAFQNKDGRLRGVAIMDARGTILATTEPPLLGRNYGYRGYLKEALRTGAPVISDVYLGVPCAAGPSTAARCFG